MKSQSAMEYLMTYGWAILIIAIVLVAFFSLGLFNPYTFKPKASPGSCQVVRPNGPNTNTFVSLVGTCLNEVPQSVAQFSIYNNYVSIPSNIIDVANNFSTSQWVSMNPVQNDANSRILTIVNDTNNYELVIFKGNGSVAVRLNGNSIETTSSPITSDARWFMVTFVEDSGGSSMYIDGVLYTHGYGTVSADGTFSAIGSGYSTTSYNLNGSISNVQVYNNALTANEVYALYKEGIGGKPINIQHLVGWWPLNGNAYDYSGNNNNGTAISVKFTSDWESGYSAP